MDFRFEPGNYYLAGKEMVDGHEVLKVDYLPTKLFDDHVSETDREARAAAGKDPDDKAIADAKEKPKSAAQQERERKQHEREQKLDAQIEYKMDKTSQITLWVDPATHQIVKYTFDNVWMDFLPAGWLVKIDDLRRLRLAVHDPAHGGGRVFTRQVFVAAQAFEQRDKHQRLSRKFCSRRWPTGVSTDSGWNCTPKTGHLV